MVSVKAYAKVNLTLWITGKRQDGYHLLDSVMQTIDLCDDINISKNSGGITISATGKAVPTGRENSMYKAAELILNEFDLPGGVDIGIVKRIPVSAGLGGPSADAASVIKGMNRLFKLGLNATQMAKIGTRIGADVPFLIEGGQALCRGIGDQMSFRGSADLSLLVIKPNVSVSTKWAYDEYDRLGAFSEPDDSGYHNDFESVVIPEYPVIGEIKDYLKGHGAGAALMSGSGSSVFGVFLDEEVKKSCATGLGERFPDAEIIPAKTVDTNLVIKVLEVTR